MTDSLIDWLFDWLFDWLIDWLTDWLIDWYNFANFLTIMRTDRYNIILPWSLQWGQWLFFCNTLQIRFFYAHKYKI